MQYGAVESCVEIGETTDGNESQSQSQFQSQSQRLSLPVVSATAATATATAAEDAHEGVCVKVQYAERYNILLILQNRAKLVVNGYSICAEPVF